MMFPGLQNSHKSFHSQNVNIVLLIVKYPYLPHGRAFMMPPPLWKFQLSFMHFFKCFSLIAPSPPPQEIPIPSVRRVWIFSGTAH